ncbi:Hint domain-containing protein [uncultured Ruegeria sp.]|uniref:Hint domain-containing protein n=1 Tax=uncultured Ruegeria sp. TaxID=259304 RepID=UPI0026176374|nr:Hint domain-containing protein [uncultured Ruegeria sp.]
MPVFVVLTDANISDPSFWAGLDVGPDSTIDARGISDNFQITITGSSITFSDTSTGTTTTYTDADLAAGSFNQFVQYQGNDADSNVSGSVGLNGSGYTGGSGNDTFQDDGSLGGTLTGGDGNDTLIGGTGNNNIDGGDGDDLLRGGSGSNNLSGGEGNDVLFGEDGSGNLDGGEGDDIINAGLNTVFVQGGAGTDSLVLPAGSTFVPFSPGSTGGNVTLPNGNTFVYVNVENVTVACFTDGTPIRTPKGDVLVEDLVCGDLVETLDHGPKPIRWIGKRTVSGRGKHAPICFLPGSIGNNRRIRLSPQHRVLLSGWKCELWLQEPELLSAAKHLCNGDRIFREPCDQVTYTHFMFDQHEIIFSDGALLESFFAGDYITQEEQAGYEELTEIFPELLHGTKDTHTTARPVIKRFEASLFSSPELT